jgi:hypothetical protein
VSDELLEGWEFPQTFDLGSMTVIAQDRRTPPDALARLVSSRGDVVTVQIVEGRVAEHVHFRVTAR